MSTKENGQILNISREAGVGDLPMRVRSKFARALLLEREAGHTTPEALAKLDEAVHAEESLS
jgi:hypothetical protein